MTARWHPTRALLGLPGMPDERAIRLHGASKGWTCRKVPWGKRTVLEWLESSLPLETQAALRLARGEVAPGSSLPAPDGPVSGEAGPSIPCADDGKAARRDARSEILTVFRAWRAAEAKAARDRALREWCALYKESGAGVSDETRALIPTVGWSTLRGWLKIDDKYGGMALLPRSGGRTSAIDADAGMLAVCEALMFERPGHITAPLIREVLEADFPDREIPSDGAIGYWMRAWRARNRRALSAVTDPDRHRSGWTPAFGDGAGDVEALNQLWELDSTKIDVMCADGKRYTLVAGLDVFSRRVRAIVAPSSRSASVALLLRRMLLDFGVPEQVRTDEGADYVSKHLCAVFSRLEVLHEILPPYSPDKKPFIERFMKTISHRLFAMLPGFVGHSVADREAIRNRWSFAGRRGQDKTITFCCDLTPEQLQQQINAWIVDVYERKPHAGLGGMSPFEKAAGQPYRKIDERGLDILLAEPAKGGGWRTVNMQGISVASGRYIAGPLGLHLRERVQVRLDPSDYGCIHVFDAEGTFICVAQDPLRTGIDPQEVAREAKALAAGLDREARKRARELAKAVVPGQAMGRVLAHAAGKSERVVAFPAPAETHRTKDTAAAAEAADAVDQIEAGKERSAEGRPTGENALIMKLWGDQA